MLKTNFTFVQLFNLLYFLLFYMFCDRCVVQNLRYTGYIETEQFFSTSKSILLRIR